MAEHVKTLDEFIDYIRGKLGEPKVRVELANSQITRNLYDAIQYYREYATGNGNWHSFMTLDTEADVQEYTLPESVMEVLSSKASKNTSAWVLAQLSGAAASDVLNLKQFDMVSFTMLNHWLRTLKIITPSSSRYHYNNNTKNLKIIPSPSVNGKMFLEVVNMATLDELYDEKWIKDYSLALCRIQLGELRGKLKSLPGFGGQVQLNGDDLLNRGVSDRDDLENDLVGEFKYSRPPFPVFHV